MNTKLKRELEELVEEQDAAAEAEQAAIVQTIIPHRVTAYQQDLTALLDLVQEKEKLLGELEQIHSQSYPSFSSEENNIYHAGSALLGVALGFTPGLIALFYYCPPNLSDMALRANLLGITSVCGGVAGLFVGSTIYRRKKYGSKKQFEQKKTKEIKEKQSELETLEQKLSRYETQYGEKDIVLVHDAEFGNYLAHVSYSDGEKLVLHQQYLKKDQLKIDTEVEIKTENPLYVLTPATELSRDDLRSLRQGTSVLCNYVGPPRPCKAKNNYGFIGGVTDDSFELYMDLNLKHSRGRYTFQEVETGEVIASLLVPENKSH